VSAFDDTIAALRAALRDRPQVRWTAAARPAAVAALLVDRDGEPYVPLIVRGLDAPVHSGQIALPGGRVEPTDRDETEAACREAFEELGVPRERIDVLGALDDVPTPTGFAITPIVARLDARDLAYAPDPREVAGWFEAPLALFRDRASAEDLGTRTWHGVAYTLRAYRHGEHRIWGATARVLEAIIDLL
jgi:8-oxo-dGTP pyrophosphatase MutT (NUDIX family)